MQGEETEAVQPPVLLPDMLARVTGTDEHSMLVEHLTAGRKTLVSHAPVLRFTYRNALVWRSGFATWRHSERYDRSRRLAELTGPIVEVPTLRYCHNYVTWRYFGHWLTDAIPSALIDRNRGAL